MAQWSARFPARVEAREDTYLADPPPGGIAVRFRHGKALELKAYQGSPGILEVAGRACGRLEVVGQVVVPLPSTRPERR